jgi:hypothetical protein
MKLVAVWLAACAVAFASASVAAQPAPTPAPTPFAIGTLQPFGTEASPLPHIGGTRALRPACAAMRDLVIPSFAAARRADARFAESRKRLPQYIDIAEDPSHQDDGYGQMLLHRLDQDVSELFQQTLVLNKALGDPYFDQHKDDPQVVAEKRALEQLYEAQRSRANLLSDFVIRERAATAKQGIDDASPFAGRSNGSATMITPRPLPQPMLTPAPGMPLRSGIPLADKARMTDWGTSLTTYVQQTENRSARTFYTIANTCR